jgi:3-hydroxymyristoyl/3-hydroxydecanoyl-(acyl carrier protein) dehydratase
VTTVTDIVIRADHPALAGHFPDNPIVPGVVLLDETLHAIARITGASVAQCTLSTVKFKNILRPGEPLTLSFDAHGTRSLRFELKSAGRAIASGVLAFMPLTETGHAR